VNSEIRAGRPGAEPLPLVFRQEHQPQADDGHLWPTEDAEEEIIDEAGRPLPQPGRRERQIREKVLVVDFGSTYTKIGHVRPADESFDLSYVPTTIDDMRYRAGDGLGVLTSACQERRLGAAGPLSTAMSEFAVRLPCSSAKGGLKMVTVSLVREEAALRPSWPR
jgi:hypothetical protein